MNELDFSGKHVLVVGGSSGIGNGIAHGLPRQRRARRRLRHPRHRGGLFADEGAHLTALITPGWTRPRQAVEAGALPFDELDVLVVGQGAVIYRRGEFDIDGFQKVVEVNLKSLMACAIKFHAMLKPERTRSSSSARPPPIIPPSATRPTMPPRPAWSG